MVSKITVLLALCTYTLSGSPYQLSKDDTHKIGQQIWFNEMGKRRELLVSWSEHESFPSLGIGHQIWLPKDSTHRYTQGFPKLCTYLHKCGVTLPPWLRRAQYMPAPWKSREEFLKDPTKRQELYKLLSSTIDVQTNFMIEQLDRRWPTILKSAPAQKRAALARSFNLLRSSLLGTYSLVDYLNFKGDGINKFEESNHQRWGLLQVLLAMPDDVLEAHVNAAFSLAAAQVLLRRIRNSVPEYTLIKFMAGWLKRVHTYAQCSAF